MNHIPSSSDTIMKASVEISAPKRRKLTGDERLNRSRERNRVHARKTRERKKNQTAALQSRINELYEEGEKLRQMIDERYTASGLLGLNNDSHSKLNKDQQPVLPSGQVCNNYYLQVLSENSWLREGTSMVGLPFINLPAPANNEKRVRRSGKYTPQERERIRRERNRMHAKKTRDRKKFFLETSEKIISEMESEASKLREYLMQLGVLSEEEYSKLKQREVLARQELAMLRVNQQHGEHHDDDDSDSEEDSEDDMVVDNQQDGSEDNEKVSSWSGSNAGSSSSSSNPSSNTGTTTTNTMSSTTNDSSLGHNNSTTSSASASTSPYDRDEVTSNNGSGSGEDYDINSTQQPAIFDKHAGDGVHNVGNMVNNAVDNLTAMQHQSSLSSLINAAQQRCDARDYRHKDPHITNHSAAPNQFQPLQ